MDEGKLSLTGFDCSDRLCLMLILSFSFSLTLRFCLSVYLSSFLCICVCPSCASLYLHVSASLYRRLLASVSVYPCMWWVLPSVCLCLSTCLSLSKFSNSWTKGHPLPQWSNRLLYNHLCSSFIETDTTPFAHVAPLIITYQQRRLPWIIFGGWDGVGVALRLDHISFTF